VSGLDNSENNETIIDFDTNNMIEIISALGVIEYEIFK